MLNKQWSEITNEGQGVLNSQTSCEGEEMEFDIESDTVSIVSTGECSRSIDLYSLEEITQFLDER